MTEQWIHQINFQVQHLSTFFWPYPHLRPSLTDAFDFIKSRESLVSDVTSGDEQRVRYERHLEGIVQPVHERLQVVGREEPRWIRLHASHLLDKAQWSGRCRTRDEHICSIKQIHLLSRDSRSIDELQFNLDRSFTKGCQWSDKIVEHCSQIAQFLLKIRKKKIPYLC